MIDFVYYLIEKGEFREDLIFSTEEEAIDFAEKEGIVEYEIAEWDVS